MEGILHRISNLGFSFTNISSAVYSALYLSAITQSFLNAGIQNITSSNYILNPSTYSPYEHFDTQCSTSIISSLLGSAGASKYPLSNTTVFFAESITKGSTIPLVNNDPTCRRPSQMVYEDTCRIAMYVQTSECSGVHVEAWLPRKWSGRFLSTGNGGLSGCIQYEDMAYGSALGFATVGTNNGHNGTSGEAFLNNPDVIEDFAYRSIHTGVILGKHLTRTFYTTPHTKSYYLGCSTGGRQGLKSIQDFPTDFDGVVAGAPAIAFNDLLSWSGRFYQLTGPPTSSQFLPPATWTGLIHSDILEQCDGIDGVKDGIIEDPNLCAYVPEKLICREGKKPGKKGCITGEQAKMVRDVFTPFYGPDGEMWFPRQQPGSEDPRTVELLYGGKMFPYTADWYRYVIHSDPTYPLHTLNLTSYTLSHNLDPFNISTYTGFLTPFHSLGGKLLTYHGQTDGLISPLNSEHYYAHILQTMGLHPEDLDDFYRFFRISGMGHCSGGVGAWEIGQTVRGIGGPGGLGFGLGEAETKGNTSEGEGEVEGEEKTGVTEAYERLNAERNVLVAMVRWVEEGIAPDFIEGRKYENDEKDEKSLEPKITRRHCRFPYRNRYSGHGDPSLPENWNCV